MLTVSIPRVKPNADMDDPVFANMFRADGLFESRFLVVGNSDK